MNRLLVMLGLSSAPARNVRTITDCVERADAAARRLKKIEQVTMSWSADTLSDEQMRDMGLSE